MFPKLYSIGSLKSKNPNFSTLKEFFKGSLDVEPSVVIKVENGVKLNLKKIVAKLAVILIIIIFAISTFFLKILF